MEPVEGERQTVMLGQPGLPAGPILPSDTRAHTYATHTQAHTLCPPPHGARQTKSNGDNIYT